MIAIPIDKRKNTGARKVSILRARITDDSRTARAT